MIRRYLNLWRADHHFNGRTVSAVAPTKREAWQALIETVAIEAEQSTRRSTNQ